MPTAKQLEEFKKRKREGMVSLKTAKERQEQMKDPKIQKRQQNAKLVAEIAGYAVPGLGLAKVGKILAGKGPAFVRRVREALNKKDLLTLVSIIEEQLLLSDVSFKFNL